VIDPKSLQIKQLVQDYADFEDPSWAPDGRHIACSRTERYRSKVYILDTGGDPPVALTDYKGDWYSPAWSPR
jgi:Tol biopolymer transport system component